MRTRSDTSMTLAGGGLAVFVSAWSAVLSILAEDPLYLACVFPSSVLSSLHYWALFCSALLSSLLLPIVLGLACGALGKAKVGSLAGKVVSSGLTRLQWIVEASGGSEAMSERACVRR